MVFRTTSRIAAVRQASSSITPHTFDQDSQMPGIARQFEPPVTRSGGAPSSYRFTVRCSTCQNTDTYEARKPVGDELVKGSFKERGWLLGRDRADDLCPACLARPQHASGA